jgi:hypothetical protein
VAANYLTDRFSTLGGLASVAYGNVNLFREVQNQIFQKSSTYFLDLHRPSQLVEDFFYSDELLKEYFLTSLETLYDTNQTFNDFVDVYVGPLWREVFVRSLLVNFKQEYDVNSNYEVTLEGYLGQAIRKTMLQASGGKAIFEDEDIEANEQRLFRQGLDFVSNIDDNFVPEELILSSTRGIAEEIKSDTYLGVDFPKLSVLLNNNPQTKISQVKPNILLSLRESVDLGKDFKDVEFEKGYLSPQDYYNNIPYPEATNISTQLPPTFKDSIRQGYIGYPIIQPLEQLYNPVGNIGAGSINLDNLTQPYFSNSVLGALSSSPSLNPNDDSVYNISLIGPALNGYTSFDPATQSNGDLLDLSNVTNYDNTNYDPQKGSNFFDRSLGEAF